MQRLEVSGAVRPLYGSLGVKGLTAGVYKGHRVFSVRYEMNLHVRRAVWRTVNATLRCQHG